MHRFANDVHSCGYHVASLAAVEQRPLDQLDRLRRRLNSIRRGLGIRRTAELTKYALEHGISGS
jgi:hypothetical protein